MFPEKVSVSIWLEPEDLTALDRFCIQTNLNRGKVIRGLLCDLLHGTKIAAQWREKCNFPKKR